MYKNAHSNFEKGFSLGIDVGVLYIGDSKVDLSTERDAAGLAADLTREAQQLKDDAWYRNFFPVGMVSLKYRF